MVNIQKKALEVAAACRMKDLPTDDIVREKVEVKTGFFAKIFGGKEQVVEDRKRFGWRLHSDERLRSETKKRGKGVNLVIADIEWVYLKSDGEMVQVEEKQITNYFGGYNASYSFKETALRPEFYEILDYSYVSRGEKKGRVRIDHIRNSRLRNWGDGLMQALRQLEQRAAMYKPC